MRNQIMLIFIVVVLCVVGCNEHFIFESGRISLPKEEIDSGINYALYAQSYRYGPEKQSYQEFFKEEAEAAIPDDSELVALVPARGILPRMFILYKFPNKEKIYDKIVTEERAKSEEEKAWRQYRQNVLNMGADWLFQEKSEEEMNQIYQDFLKQVTHNRNQQKEEMTIVWAKKGKGKEVR